MRAGAQPEASSRVPSKRTNPKQPLLLLAVTAVLAPVRSLAQEPPINFDKARQIFERFRRGEQVTDEERAYVERAARARRSKRSRPVATALYLGMGWAVVVAIRPLLHSVAPGGLILLACGGLAYTTGTVFYLWRGPRYHHAIWHLFVLAGSGLHFFAVLFYVIPLAGNR